MKLDSCFQEWATLRQSLNHQWLANNYLNQLRYWVSEMEADGEDPLFDADFINDTLTQWCHRTTDAQWIVDHASDAISPARLFEKDPFIRIPQEIREPVAEACHLLWLERTKETLQRAKDAKKAVDINYDSLRECLDSCPVPRTQKSTKRCLPLALRFEAACKELNKALEDLPKIEYW